MRETKLLFKESLYAERLAEVLLSSSSIFGYQCQREKNQSYTDLYYDGAEKLLMEQGCAIRLRKYQDGKMVWQRKTRQVGRGNEWVYKVENRKPISEQPPRVFTQRSKIEPLIKIHVNRRTLALTTPTGAISVCVDICTYQSVTEKELGHDIEIEVKSKHDCTAFDPVVEHLRSAFALVPATRPKLARGMIILRGKQGFPRKVILDMDPGVDDALAILLALASPELEVLAITTVAGNVDLRHTTFNARTVVDAAKRLYGADRLPVISRGLTPHGDIPDASDVHGKDGLGGYSNGRKPASKLSTKRAPDLIAHLLDINPGKVTIVATGPLTNIAACARKHPESLAKAKALVAMGGVFFQEGNRTAAAEFNVHRDPESAQSVIQFARNPLAGENQTALPITFVGLDVTHRVRLYREDLKGRRDAKSAFVRAVSSTYMSFYKRNEGLDGCYLHDPLAVAYVIDPSLCVVEPFHVEVETTGTCTMGATIADTRPSRQFGEPAKRVTNVCVTVDAERARKLILERVLGWDKVVMPSGTQTSRK